MRRYYWIYAFCPLVATILLTIHSETEAQESGIYHLDYSHLIRSIKEETAAGIFAQGLFETPDQVTGTVDLNKLPEMGTNWIELFNLKYNSDSVHKNVELHPLFEKWLRSDDFKLKVDTVVNELQKEINDVEKEKLLVNKYCSDKNGDVDIPIDNEGEPLIRCYIYQNPDDIDRLLSRYENQISVTKATKIHTDSQYSSCIDSIGDIQSDGILEEFCINLLETYKRWNRYNSNTSEEEKYWNDVDMCEDDDVDDSFFENECERRILSLDYENEYSINKLVPLSIQRKIAEEKRVDESKKHIIESKLTSILEQIKVNLETQLMQENDSVALRSVNVRIVNNDEYNINASKHTNDLEIPEGILRDVYLRSFHRANITFNLSMGEPLYQEMYGDARHILYSLDSLESLQKLGSNKYYISNVNDQAFSVAGRLTQPYPCCSFSNNITDFIYLMGYLPGIRILKISPSWLLSEINSVDNDSFQQKWHDIKVLLSNNNNEEYLFLSIEPDDLATLFAELEKHSPDPKRDIALASYLNESRRIIELLNGINDIEYPLFELEAYTYFPLFAELVMMQQMVSAELLKSYLYLLAHESWHLWFQPDDIRSPSQFKQEEFNADAHGMRVYLATYPEIDLDAWSKALEPSDTMFSTGDSTSFQGFFEAFSGREPSLLLEEAYRGTKYYHGTFTHPSVPDRVEKLKIQVEQGKKEFTKSILAELSCALSGNLFNPSTADCTNIE